MTLKVTVLDVETGQRGEATVVDGDYLLVAAAPCELDHVQADFADRLAVLTLKGWAPRGKSVANEDVEQSTKD